MIRAGLTYHQCAVALRYIQGKTNKDICAEFGLTNYFVNTNFAYVKRKLRVDNVAQLVHLVYVKEYGVEKIDYVKL